MIHPADSLSEASTDRCGRKGGSRSSRSRGQRTRYSAQLDFEGHGLGVLLAPLVRRDAGRQLPDSLQRLKRKLEAS